MLATAPPVNWLWRCLSCHPVCQCGKAQLSEALRAKFVSVWWGGSLQKNHQDCKRAGPGHRGEFHFPPSFKTDRRTLRKDTSTALRPQATLLDWLSGHMAAHLEFTKERFLRSNETKIESFTPKAKHLGWHAPGAAHCPAIAGCHDAAPPCWRH